MSSLEERFNRSALIATSLSLVPTILCTQNVSLHGVVDNYSQTIKSPELLPSEIHRWKARYLSIPEKLRPLKNVTRIFSKHLTLLQLLCTIRVTSCEYEHRANALRWLHNNMRASMTTKTFSNLALFHIHYDDDLDLNEAVSIFTKLHIRRIELDTLLLLYH